MRLYYIMAQSDIDNEEEQHTYISAQARWTSDIDQILENIRHNCIILSEYHRSQYFQLQKKLKYFRIPVILISSCAGFFNFGLQPYMDQNMIAMICSVMSLFVGLLGSMELYLQLQKKMESELDNSREYYLNAIDIYKVIRLDRKHRNGEGKTYLEERYGVYRKLIESSNLVLEDYNLADFLAPRKNAISKKDNSDKIADRFDLYCNLVENTDINETNIMQKLVPLLISGPGKTVDDISFQDKINLYCTLVESISPKNKELLEQIKPYLLTNDVNKDNGDSIKERFSLYTDVMKYKDVIPEDSIKKIKTLLVNDIKLNFDDNNQFENINKLIKHKNNDINLPHVEKLTRFTDMFGKMSSIQLNSLIPLRNSKNTEPSIYNKDEDIDDGKYSDDLFNAYKKV